MYFSLLHLINLFLASFSWKLFSKPMLHVTIVKVEKRRINKSRRSTYLKWMGSWKYMLILSGKRNAHSVTNSWFCLTRCRKSWKVSTGSAVSLYVMIWGVPEDWLEVKYLTWKMTKMMKPPTFFFQKVLLSFSKCDGKSTKSDLHFKEQKKTQNQNKKPPKPRKPQQNQNKTCTAKIK